MMFDPPDYPYKELTETYEDLLLNKSNTESPSASASASSSASASASAIVEDALLDEAQTPVAFQSNEGGRFFNVESPFLQSGCSEDSAVNNAVYVIQPEHLLNYEPTLLDDNTVDQFLLPLQDSAEGHDKEAESSGPDLLALHSCVICHDIFTTEGDLLDHAIAFHASMNILEADANELTLFEQSEIQAGQGETNAEANVETDWLVCLMCERVLSTALEVETKEQHLLCCVDKDGKGSVSARRLDTMFVCELCSGLFAAGDALERHRPACYLGHSSGAYDQKVLGTTDVYCPEVGFTCDHCRKPCSSTEELKAHLMDCRRPMRAARRTRAYSSVNNNKMWNCGSCNQLFTTARELYRHKRGEDRPEGAPLTAYVCEECDKVLGSVCALHTHKKMHKVYKPGYPCRICGRRFNQSGHLAIHMRMHTGERPYPCDLCPKAFKVKVERDDHRRTHTGERPFACAACPKTFTAAARLREHARIHTDQRPYRCDICGAAFRRPYARTVHTLIHTGEKPHECDVCGTAFRRSGDMWKHKRTIHGVL